MTAAVAFWPWSLLAQPEPLPERLIGAAPEAVLDHALGPDWGTPAATFDDSTRSGYLEQLGDVEHVHAICEDYRAATHLDRDHDRADRAAGRQIECPVLTLWSAIGPLEAWYTDLGGPLEMWRELAPDITGRPVAGGHFFPEEHPRDTARAPIQFFGLSERSLEMA